MAKKVAPLTENALAILEAIKASGAPVTASTLKEAGVNANGSQLKALEDRGFITSEVQEVDIPRIVKTKVKAYSFVAPAEASADSE